MTQPAEKARIELRSVRKNFGALTVVHDIDLAVEGGEFVVFVGPSGCGKSTLLRMIAGLEDVTAGDILIAGRDVTELDPSKRGIAMVFQSYALYPHMSVRQNLAFGLEMAKTRADEIERQVQSAADILKIGALLERRPGQLSGGQRQRVAIGRAIVRKPLAFLFDEPLSNLDAELRVSMRIEIARLHRELGNTMIYVTHDQTEAMTLADRIVVLRDGRIEQVGTPHEIYDNPNNLFVAGFIGSPRMNIVDAVYHGDGRVTVADTTILLGHTLAGIADGETVKFGIRPEHLTIGGKLENALRANVDFAEYLGSTRYLYSMLSTGEALTIEQRDGPALSSGEEVWLEIDVSRVRLFSNDGNRLRATGAGEGCDTMTSTATLSSGARPLIALVVGDPVLALVDADARVELLWTGAVWMRVRLSSDAVGHPTRHIAPGQWARELLLWRILTIPPFKDTAPRKADGKCSNCHRKRFIAFAMPSIGTSTSKSSF